MIGVLVAVLAVFAHPGAVDPRVTPATIHETICRPGYSASVRPPVSYTAPIKRRLLAGRDPAAYQLDHLIPLEVGGAPRALANLRLEPIVLAHQKDDLEDSLHRDVCAGRVGLRAAQRQFRVFVDEREVPVG